MKRLLALILVWTLLVITGTLVSADGHALRQSEREQAQQVHTPTRAVSIITDVISY